MEYVYLDHAATTALRPEVHAAMAPYLSERFGNPSSTHRWGRQARNALEEARERVAAALGARRREVVFTGGGTESDNLAVLGRWRLVCAHAAVPRADAAARHGPAAPRYAGTSGAMNGTRPGSAVAYSAVAYSAVEHKAVSAAARQAGAEGAMLIVLGVDATGRVDMGAVAEAVAAQPCVLSVMWGNNEVGTLQPVAAIAAQCRSRDVIFHTDAVQAFGKVRVRVDEIACDLLSLSGHKLGGPKGVGVLYIREGVRVLPLEHGGGQERDLRPGTENVAGAVGCALAAELAAQEQTQEEVRLSALRERLRTGLVGALPELMVNGSSEHHLPHVLNVTVPEADAEMMLIALDLEGVAASGGSACQSGAVQASHVLAAMGSARAGAAVRFSFGRTSSMTDVDTAIAAFARVVHQMGMASA